MTELRTLLARSAIAVLEQALSCEHGLRIAIVPMPGTSLPNLARRAKQMLYSFRKELAPRFDTINIRLAPDAPERALLLLRRSAPTVHHLASTELAEALDDLDAL